MPCVQIRIGSSLAGGLGQIGISVQVSVISSAIVDCISCRFWNLLSLHVNFNSMHVCGGVLRGGRYFR